MARPLVLISGFGPFERFRENPSALVARALARRPPPGLDVRAAVLPVSFARAPQAWERGLARCGRRRPDLILGLGVHGDRGFRLETRGGPRLRRRRRPDVDGRLPAEYARAESPLRTPVDARALAARLRRKGVRAVRVSASAGGFVCEWTYHHLLARGSELGIPALFVHVPPRRATPLARQVAVLGLLLRELLAVPTAEA